ncbi:hypothetical protein HWV62_31303 [Athelia sp. TMB]|nr:hypothetical protein HWV62_31303 [Athelia sp. TMB]
MKLDAQLRSLPSRLDPGKGGKKKKSSRENSSAPRAPPPPIHLPNPNEPPPPNFLRNQMGLLGTAGLVGGVHAAKLSVERHTRGTTPSNPIVVEDTAIRPATRVHKPHITLDPSSTVPPSNEEIIASLIREKNVYPVLESILKLIKGNNISKSQSSGSGREESSEPAAKRRRFSSEVEGAAQEIASNLEKERGKELIAQLVLLIKNAARQAAMRTYNHHQQNPQARRAQPPQRWNSKPQGPETKIMGHYRPITATYGRPQATLSEVLADQSNTTFNVSQTSAATNPTIQPILPVHPHPSISTTQQSIHPLPHLPEATTSAQSSFDQFLSSLLAPPGENNSSAGYNLEPESLSPSSSYPEVDQHAMNTWMSIFGSAPTEDSLAGTSSHTPSEFDMDFMMSPHSDFSYQSGLADFLPDDGIQDADLPATSNANSGFVIDPFLLNLPPLPSTTASLTQHASNLPLGPSQAVPLESSSSRASLNPQCTGPEPFRDATVQGMLDEHAQYLRNSFILLSEDPLAAANALLHFSAASSATAMTQAPEQMQSEASAVRQALPRTTYQLFPLNAPAAASQPLPTVARPHQTSQKAVTVRPMPTADKQSILIRAKERRRQLVGEIDRAKVELWETTIEQGVLAQLVKEKL